MNFIIALIFVFSSLFAISSCGKIEISESICYGCGPGEKTQDQINYERSLSAKLCTEYGSGTPEDPYLIYNSDQLVHLSTQCSSSIQSACINSFRLETDIEMSGYFMEVLMDAKTMANFLFNFERLRAASLISTAIGY